MDVDQWLFVKSACGNSLPDDPLHFGPHPEAPPDGSVRKE